MLLECITSYLNGTYPSTRSTLEQETYQSQLDIGHHLLLRGFLSTEWTRFLRYVGHERPENAITNIITHIWHDFFHRIWIARNAAGFFNFFSQEPRPLGSKILGTAQFLAFGG